MNINPDSSRALTERGDCTVRAIARAFNVSYNTAHEWLKKAGRKDRSGFHMANFFGIGYGIRCTKKSRTLKKRRISFKKPRRQPTIKTFIKKFPTGVFVCSKAHHAFCIINGEVFGQALDCSRIQYYWRIGPEKVKDKQMKAA